jgi:hypothetical protein
MTPPAFLGHPVRSLSILGVAKPGFGKKNRFNQTRYRNLGLDILPSANAAFSGLPSSERLTLRVLLFHAPPCTNLFGAKYQALRWNAFAILTFPISKVNPLNEMQTIRNFFQKKTCICRRVILYSL